MDDIRRDECGFDAFRTGWPNYTKSVFRNKTEIVTDGRGTILGVTNPERLLWARLPESAEDVQILEVAKGAFSPCKKLRTIEFCDNLEVIGQEAFSSCSMLTYVKLPDTLYEIGEGAFEKTALKSFALPLSVDCVPSRCFMDDMNLESVVLHKNVKRLGILAFSGCSSLRSVDIPEGVGMIEEGLFMSSGLRTIHLPSSIREIGNSALSSCRSLLSIFYDGKEEEFRRITFGRNWNRGMNSSCALYLKDSRGYWYNAFSEKREAVHEREDIRSALSLFGLERIPSESELVSLYRKKAMAFHPDRLSGLNLDSEYSRFAEERFCEYRKAYELLLPYCRKDRT